jgi:hypothetical protein
MLAHKAEEEAVAVVEYIKKGYGHVNYSASKPIIQLVLCDLAPIIHFN